MSAPCGPDSDIADWLASIHLERYRDAFKQHGYRVARDATSLDSHHLQQIGVTATGHRKRILALAQQTRMLSRCRGRAAAADTHSRGAEALGAPQEGKDAMRAEPGGSGDALGTQPSVAVPGQAAKEPAPPAVKPVPKPRTVFPRSKAEQGSVPVPPARSAVPAAFVVLEGFVPGESSTDSESPEPGADPGAMGVIASRLRGRDSSREDTRPPPSHGQSAGTSQKSPPPVPRVPPRHRARALAAEPGPGGVPEGPSAPLPGPAGREPSPCSRRAPGQGRLEMVSNVIYEGLEAPAEEPGEQEGPRGEGVPQAPALSPHEQTPPEDKPE